jgi:hypothetical protein
MSRPVIILFYYSHWKEGLRDRGRLFITLDRTLRVLSGPPKCAPRDITKINQRVRALNSFLLFGPLKEEVKCNKLR